MLECVSTYRPKYRGRGYCRPILFGCFRLHRGWVRVEKGRRGQGVGQLSTSIALQKSVHISTGISKTLRATTIVGDRRTAETEEKFM